MDNENGVETSSRSSRARFSAHLPTLIGHALFISRDGGWNGGGGRSCGGDGYHEEQSEDQGALGGSHH
jgi:hypothetical protein